MFVTTYESPPGGNGGNELRRRLYDVLYDDIPVFTWEIIPDPRGATTH